MAAATMQFDLDTCGARGAKALVMPAVLYPLQKLTGMPDSMPM
jgi:hypothetical protein